MKSGDVKKEEDCSAGQNQKICIGLVSTLYSNPQGDNL